MNKKDKYLVDKFIEANDMQITKTRTGYCLEKKTREREMVYMMPYSPAYESIDGVYLFVRRWLELTPIDRSVFSTQYYVDVEIPIIKKEFKKILAREGFVKKQSRNEEYYEGISTGFHLIYKFKDNYVDVEWIHQNGNITELAVLPYHVINKLYNILEESK